MNLQKKKSNIIYHNKDLDGFCSAMIVFKYLLGIGVNQSQINLIGYDYADEKSPKIPAGDVYIVDLCLPDNDMILLRSAVDEVVWIDHHKTSIDNSIGKWDWFEGSRKIGDSAALLSWRFFFGDAPVPPLVEVIDRFDVWKRGEDWEEILMWQYGLRKHTYDPGDNIDDWMTLLDMKNLPLDIYNDGRTILEYIKEQNAKTAKRSFDLQFHGLTFLAVNQGDVNSNVADTVALPYHDGILTFKYDGAVRKWVVSLYGNEDADRDFDLSKIAKAMGGGGHAKACGFTVSSIEELFKFDENHISQGCGKVLVYHRASSVEDDLGELDPTKACKGTDGICESCQ